MIALSEVVGCRCLGLAWGGCTGRIRHGCMLSVVSSVYCSCSPLRLLCSWADGLSACRNASAEARTAADRCGRRLCRLSSELCIRHFSTGTRADRVAFAVPRVIHVLVDVHTGRLERPGAAALIQYLWFWPTIVIGPIHRFEEHHREQRRARGIRNSLFAVWNGCSSGSSWWSLLRTWCRINGWGTQSAACPMIGRTARGTASLEYGTLSTCPSLAGPRCDRLAALLGHRVTRISIDRSTSRTLQRSGEVGTVPSPGLRRSTSIARSWPSSEPRGCRSGDDGGNRSLARVLRALPWPGLRITLRDWWSTVASVGGETRRAGTAPPNPLAVTAVEIGNDRLRDARLHVHTISNPRRCSGCLRADGDRGMVVKLLERLVASPAPARCCGRRCRNGVRRHDRADPLVLVGATCPVPLHPAVEEHGGTGWAWSESVPPAFIARCECGVAKPAFDGENELADGGGSARWTPSSSCTTPWRRSA